MEGTAYYFVIGAVVWVLAAAYLAWRVRRSVQRRMQPPTELTWLIYLAVFTVAIPIASLAGRWSRPAALAVLAAALVVSFILSYRAIGRYRKWLEEQEKKEKER